MNPADESYPSSPDFWRLSTAARMAGISPDVLARACATGAIPVTMVELGPRSRFVKVSEFNAWRAGKAGATASDVDLFGGSN
jgi:hypothetical protein